MDDMNQCSYQVHTVSVMLVKGRTEVLDQHKYGRVRSRYYALSPQEWILDSVPIYVYTNSSSVRVYWAPRVYSQS